MISHTGDVELMIQRDPVVVYWPSVFLEAWSTKAKHNTFSGTYWFIGLAAFGGRVNKPIFSLTSVVFLPWYPRPPTNHLANKPLRDPFE
jgi:hypothetical protein